MVIRPLDASGDILPVLRTGDMPSGAEAVALLVRHRLNLLSGEWWENPAWGNGILKMLQESRLTEADAQSLSVYLSDDVRDAKGVQEVTDIRFSMDRSRFSWECMVITEYGKTPVKYEV